MPIVRRPRSRGRGNHSSDDDESTPICRCRVLYLGSAVPHITKDGLQGIQEPLKELYPDTGLSSLKGIDSWLSVWSNGLLLENVDEKNTKITRFFPIESLHYCAAVRNVLVPATGSSSEKVQKFLPLDSPFARLPNLNHPPLFACILRRTTGIKVLECHAFICKREMAANALVRCCFHAYADSTYAKQLENGGTGTLLSSNGMVNGFTNGNSSGVASSNGNGGGTLFKDSDRPIQRSVTPLDSIEKVAGWQALSQNGDSDILVVGNNSTDDDLTDGPVASTPRNNKYEFTAEFPDEDEIYEGDENHKVWGGSSANNTTTTNNGSTLLGGSSGHNGTSSSELLYLEPDGTLKSIKSQGSRVSKPRQFISPPPPPPPPPQQYSLLKSVEDDAGSTTKKKTKKKLKSKDSKSASQQQLHLQHQFQQQMTQPRYLMRPASMMNLSSGHQSGGGPSSAPRAGSVLNGPVSHRPGSAMSTLTRTRPFPQGSPQHGGPPHLIPVPHHHHGNGFPIMMPPHPMHPHGPPQPIYGPLPPPHFMQPMLGKKSKKKQKQQMLTPVPMIPPAPISMLPPPHIMQPQMNGHGPPKGSPHHPHHHLPHHHMMMNGNGPHHHPHHHMMSEEKQNGVVNKSSPELGGPMPTYYATIERGYHYHTGPSSRHNGNGSANGNMSGSSGNLNGDSTMTSTKSKSKSGSGSKSNSGSNSNHHMGNGGSNHSNNNNNNSNGGSHNKNREGSPFNTGIYRKKGHLNERAFSYSIRQEHRSRSYGSLTNLQFANEAGGSLLRPAGTSPHTSEGIKKEREIIQMVRDLDLSGDEIERSQVPADMYPGRRINGYRLQNGHPGPRITHR